MVLEVCVYVCVGGGGNKDNINNNDMYVILTALQSVAYHRPPHGARKHG